MGIKQNKLLAIFIVMTIIFYNCQGVISYSQMITSSKDQSNFLKREDTTISPKDNISSRSILGEEITYEGKARSVTEKPYITRISKSQIAMGNYYQATISIYGQAKYGTTVYANIGNQESSQKIGLDQTFGFTVNTIRQSITIEFYAVSSNGSKSESVFVTCTPNGDYITGNGTYPTNNTAPVIKSNDKVFNLGQVISESILLKDVTAYDEEDGDLTSKVIVKSHDIHSNSVGTYSVIYEVTDSAGETTEKENKVKIIDPNSNNQFEYTVSGGSVTIEGYNGDKADIVIPEEIEGYPVKSIAWGAFDKNEKIITVKIPSTVTEISANAFRDCINLTSVNIPEGVKVLTGGVFNNCKSLKSIKIPKSVTTLEVYSFNNCSSLTEVEIPENVTFIGYNSFTGCTNLSKIIIPRSVTTIEANTFTKNDILTIYGYKNSAAETYAKSKGIKFKYIDVNSSPVITSSDKVFNLGSNISNSDLLKNVTAYDEEDGDLTSKVIVKSHNINSNLVGIYKVIYKVTDSAGQTTEKENKVQIVSPNLNKEFEYDISGGSVTIEGYNGEKTDIVIPDKIEGYPVESIAYGAFKNNKNIVSVTVPNGITQLNGYTFSGCTNLETVKLPDSLIYIYDNVFSNCIKLKTINIPSKVKLIYVYAFYKCSSLEKIDLPESIEEIGYSAFSDCVKLKSIKIPTNIKVLQNHVFSGCQSLTEVEIPNGISTIESYAFYGCSNLNKVTVPKSVNFIGDDIFYKCGQNFKIYGYKNSYIEQYAKNTGLTFVYIKETNTSPIIAANNLTVNLGQKINLMEKVSASDYEDGDITSKIKIVENTVDITKVGTYKVVYSVTDSDENTVKKEIKVTVIKKEEEKINVVSYKTHVEDYGWQDWKSNGAMSGTSGEAKRLEAIEIKVDNLPGGAIIKYRTHVEDYGWQGWKSNGETSGTSGEAKRLEAIEIKLENAPGYSVQYRTHVEDYGWQSWKSNGQMSGTSGEAKRLEAIEIKIVKNVDVEYRTHVEDYGWQSWKSSGQMSGTSGEAKRLEAIEIKSDNLPEGAIIKYRTHVEDYGWQSWKSNGQMSGTSGEAKRLEAIEIKLENAPGYSVQYRTHVEDYGWQDWKSDGEMSGTSGQAKRLEAIEVRIVKK